MHFAEKASFSIVLKLQPSLLCLFIYLFYYWLIWFYVTVYLVSFLSVDFASVKFSKSKTKRSHQGRRLSCFNGSTKKMCNVFVSKSNLKVRLLPSQLSLKLSVTRDPNSQAARYIYDGNIRRQTFNSTSIM